MLEEYEDSIELIFIESSLSIDFEHKKQRFDTETQDKINANWEESKKCFNGELIHVNKFLKDDTRICFLTQIGSYKDFIGTKDERPDSLMLACGKADCCMPLSIGAIVITKDGKIIVAKRNGTNLNNDFWSFPAEGYFNPKHAINGQVSIFNGIADELKEELGININELIYFRVLGIVFDRVITKQPYIAIIWKTNLSSFEIKSRFNKTKREEFKIIDFIENKKIPFLDFIKEHELTLHNLGKAILYGLYMEW